MKKMTIIYLYMLFSNILLNANTITIERLYWEKGDNCGGYCKTFYTRLPEGEIRKNYEETMKSLLILKQNNNIRESSMKYDVPNNILFDLNNPEYNNSFTKTFLKYKPLETFSKKEIGYLIHKATGDLLHRTEGYNGSSLKKMLNFLDKNKINYDSSKEINEIMKMTKKEMKYYSSTPVETILKARSLAIQILLKHLPDVNFISDQGSTVLIWATKHNQFRLAQKLIEAGADIRLTDDAGYTALSYAENNKNKNMMKLIKGGTSGKQTGIDKLLAKKSAKPNYNSFALIVGISKYMNETQVDYADNSAKSFKLLAENVLGVPKENIILMTNEKATSGQLKSNIELISQLVEDGSTIYFYYAGHGVPGTNGKTYLLPSDMKADNIEIEKQLSISNIYDKLVKSPAKEVIVFMDSCFSGKDDSGKLLYKGVAPVLKNKKITIDKSKLAVFSAGSSSDFANQYKDEEQRLFSYFVMKGLLEGKKNSDELSNYVKSSVKRKSLRLGLSYKQVPQYSGREALKIVK